MRTLLLLAFTFVLSTTSIRAQTEVTFYTSLGNFVVETYDTLQPITSGNFLSLVNNQFYDGVIFHRVISNFVVQGGDPTGTGSGGPGYTITDEFDSRTSNVQKALSMANAGPNTGGSQFFINLVNNTFLNPKHPVFGIVVSNFNVVQSMASVSTNSNDRPIVDIVMDSVRVTSPFIGIDEFERTGFMLSVYPNPAEDYISIILDDKTDNSNDYLLTISDRIGQTVYSQSLEANNSIIDVSSINIAGIYFLNISNEATGQSLVKKIMIQ